MTDCKGVQILSPSKITDYFPSSPKAHSTKEKDCLDEKTKISQEDSSSVLLTPEASPAKENASSDKGSPSEGEGDTDTRKKETEVNLTTNTNSEDKCQCAEESSINSTEGSSSGRHDNFDSNCIIEGSCINGEGLKKSDRSGSDSSQDQPKPSKPKQVHVDKSTTATSQKGKTKSKPTSSQTSSKTEKSASGKNRKKKPDALDNTLLTDYYPVRRSYRKTKSELEKEKQQDLEAKVLNKREDGLEVQEIAGKGRGVVATKLFHRGEFVIEYAGDLIDIDTAKKREEKYSKDPAFGCYMYYFIHKSKNYCIDATAESGRLGRLINHSKVSGNCHTKLVDIRDRPYLILVASRDISVGEELLYDYGDRSKSSLESHPWLKC